MFKFQTFFRNSLEKKNGLHYEVLIQALIFKARREESHSESFLHWDFLQILGICCLKNSHASDFVVEVQWNFGIAITISPILYC